MRGKQAAKDTLKILATTEKYKKKDLTFSSSSTNYAYH